jgi:hypothetical protein
MDRRTGRRKWPGKRRRRNRKRRNRGYGSACLAGMRYLQGLPASEQPEIVVFLDGDYSDYPEDLPNVAGPVLNDGKDLVIGSRMLGNPEPGAMTLPQRFGNWLAPAPDPLAVRLPVHRPRPLSGHSLGKPAGPGHAGPQLRLDGGNAGQGGPAGLRPAQKYRSATANAPEERAKFPAH